MYRLSVYKIWMIQKCIDFVVMTKENQRKHSGSQFGELQFFIVGGAAVGAWGSQAHRFLGQEERDERWCWLTLYRVFLKIRPRASSYRMNVPIIFKAGLAFSFKPLWKRGQRHTQICVSWITQKPVELTVKVSQHNQCRENYEYEHFFHVLTQCDF